MISASVVITGRSSRRHTTSVVPGGGAPDQLAKGVFKAGEEAGLAAKFGSGTSSAESTAVREREPLGIRVGEDVAGREGCARRKRSMAFQTVPFHSLPGT
jgi:hypothetical protein